MPNLLGRTFKYFYDAMQYARSGVDNARPVRNSLATKVLVNTARSSSAGGTQANIDYFAQLAATNPAFMAAADRISNRVADAEHFIVQFREGSDWMDDEDHQFLTALANPNAFMTGAHMMAETALWMNTYGNAYWYLVTDTPGVGPVREIWPLIASKAYPDPLTLRRSYMTGKLTVDYRYTVGSPILLPGENVVHFRTPNLFDWWQGMAKMTSLQQALSMDMGESSYLNSFFEEGNAVPSAIISVPREVTNEELDIIQRDIQEQFGARRATAVARAGEMDVKVIQHTIQEMQVLQGMEFNARRIGNVLGIPEGIGSASSGTARLAAEIAFAKDVVQPLLNTMAAFLSVKVVPMYDYPEKMRIVAQNVIPQDSAIEVAEYEAYRDDDTINGNRKKRNLEPLKLTGKLAKYQQYLDEVPLEILHDLLAAEIAAGASEAAQPPATARSGENTANAAGATTRVPLQTRTMTQRKTKRVTDTGKLGVRTTGQPTTRAELNHLMKSVMSEDELRTLNLLV